LNSLFIEKVIHGGLYIGYKIVLSYLYLDYIIKFLKEIKSLKERKLHEKKTSNPTINLKIKNTRNRN